MERVKSELPFDYVTIKVTQSRIDKGLIAIPVSLIDLFPQKSDKIFLVNEFGKTESKSFTPYSSSSRECRIGGLRKFFDTYKVVDGEELVIQMIDEITFRLIPEKLFKKILNSYLSDFKKSTNDIEIEKIISNISVFSNLPKSEVLRNEFVLLSKERIKERKMVEKNKFSVRERVPFSIRKILLELYAGKCQITNFTFLTKNEEPFFEVHHIDPNKGNHLKNLLVVCPNTHAQFTYARLEQEFDNEGWLRKVKFNNEIFNVFQIIDELYREFEKQVHF